jgi:uncharacterized protein YcaQ
MPLATARTLAVVKQGLHRRPNSADRRTLLDTIRRIGLLQIDAIHVVARSQYLVMLSRVGRYDPSELDALLYPDRQLFEHWAHAACLIPREHYAYFAPLILQRREQTHRRVSHLGSDPQAVLSAVMDEIRQRGPLASKDFEDPDKTRGAWWDLKPAKHALEILLDHGHLLVDRRVGFQRYYDLAERVLPESAETPAKTLTEWRRWATHSGVRQLGVATADHISDYYRQKKADVRAVIATLVDEGSVVPVEVEGWPATAFIDSTDLSTVDQIESGACHSILTTFLSPFDNLIWDRRRVADLFQFDYRLEAYMPAATRSQRFGYFVLPILHRGRLIGRLDPKADRQTKTLIIKGLYLEPDEHLTEEMMGDVTEAVREFMVFHDSESLVIENSNSKPLQEELLRHVGGT